MQPTSVLFICLGNICRSPLAEGLFREALAREGLSERVRVDSCGTSGHHVGEPPHPGSVRAARRRGVDITGQRARRLRPEDARDFEHLVCMDAANRRDVLRALGPREVWLMREFDPLKPGPDGVPDPWGHGPEAFEEVCALLGRCAGGLLDRLRAGGLHRPLT